MMVGVLLGLGTVCLFVILFIIFSREDPSTKIINKIDEQIRGSQRDMESIKANLEELPKITKLLKEISATVNRKSDEPTINNHPDQT